MKIIFFCTICIFFFISCCQQSNFDDNNQKNILAKDNISSNKELEENNKTISKIQIKNIDNDLLNQAPKNMINTMDEYKKMTLTYPEKRMVRVSDYISAAKIDLRYAHYDNLFKQPIYKTNIAYLNIKATEALKKVNNELIEDGYRLIIWDAYRPYSVTVEMWNIVQDSRYAATPQKGSRHNRGMAVDVSFEKLNGDTVIMPTQFDECTRQASPLFQGIPLEAKKNRDYLIQKMKKHGFKVLNSEWWHFDYKDCWSVPVMNLSFEELQKL